MIRSEAGLRASESISSKATPAGRLRAQVVLSRAGTRPTD